MCEAKAKLSELLDRVGKGEDSSAADDLAAAVQNFGALAPTLWAYDVTSGIDVAQRRGRLTPALADQSLDLLLSLPIEFVHPRGDRLRDIANQTGLTVYDANYLEVYRMHGLPLATVDAQMRLAALSLDIEILS